MRRWIAALLLVAAGCGGADTGPVTVKRSGSVISRGTIYVAAELHAASDTFGPIRLRVTLLDDKGAVQAETDDGLPYCPKDESCWWGASFPLDQFEGSRDIAAANVQVAGTPRRYRSPAQIRSVSLSRSPDGRLRGRVPGDEGYVYLIGFDDDAILGGLFTSVSHDDGRTVPFVAATVDAIGGSDGARAYFYATRVPRGD